MSEGTTLAAARRRHGRRRRDDPRGPGRSDVPRRHQAGHRAPADPHERRRARSSATSPRRPATIALNAGPRHAAPVVANTGDRPIQVGSHYHFAETNPRCASTARRRAACGWTSPPAPPCASSPASSAPSSWWRTTATRVVQGFRGASDGAALDDSRIDRRAYAEMYGPTTGRPRAPGRHRPGHRDRDDDLRPMLRRGGEVRRRQGHPRRHGAGQRTRRRRCADYGDHQRARSSTTGASSRPTSASRTGASRPSARPATPTCSRASTSSSARAPRSSPAKAASSRPAASTAHIHFICPQQIEDALMSGVTTMIGGGTGPADRHLRDHLHARPVEHRAHAAGGRRASR